MWFALQAWFDPEIHDITRAPTLLVIFPALTSSVCQPYAHSSFPWSVKTTAPGLTPCALAPRRERQSLWFILIASGLSYMPATLIQSLK